MMLRTGRASLSEEQVDHIFHQLLLETLDKPPVYEEMAYKNFSRLGVAPYSELAESPAAAKDWRTMTGCSRGPYRVDNWVDGFRTLAGPLATCKNWRRRCLEVLMQRITLCDHDYDKVAPLSRFVRLCEVNSRLPHDLRPATYIRHLSFGDPRGGICLEALTWWNRRDVALVHEALSWVQAPVWMPKTLTSLRWRCQVPIIDNTYGLLSWMSLTDVFVSCDGLGLCKFDGE